MRSILLIFLLTSIGFTSVGQVPKEFNYWFYDLPIVKNPDKVFDIISKDRRFIDKQPNDTVEYLSLYKRNF